MQSWKIRSIRACLSPLACLQTSDPSRAWSARCKDLAYVSMTVNSASMTANIYDHNADLYKHQLLEPSFYLFMQRQGVGECSGASRRVKGRTSSLTEHRHVLFIYLFIFILSLERMHLTGRFGDCGLFLHGNAASKYEDGDILIN